MNVCENFRWKEAFYFGYPKVLSNHALRQTASKKRAIIIIIIAAAATTGESPKEREAAIFVSQMHDSFLLKIQPQPSHITHSRRGDSSVPRVGFPSQVPHLPGALCHQSLSAGPRSKTLRSAGLLVLAVREGILHRG